SLILRRFTMSDCNAFELLIDTLILIIISKLEVVIALTSAIATDDALTTVTTSVNKVDLFPPTILIQVGYFLVISEDQNASINLFYSNCLQFGQNEACTTIPDVLE